MTAIIHVIRQMPLAPCMGGWCAVRETCARYWQSSLRTPADRYCTGVAHDQWVALPAPRSGERIAA